MQLRLFVFLLFWGSIAVGQPNTLGTAFLGTDGCYTLTSNGPGQVGAVWFEDTLDLTKPFVIDTRVLLGSSDFGADGMVIVLMNDPGNSIGLHGQQLGYGSLTNAFGAEIDIFQNGPPTDDPAYDHVAYHTGGTVIHAPSPALSAPVSALPGNANIEDQNWHRAQLYWYPDSQKLDLYIDCSLRLSRTVDLQSILGVSEVQWGATAATGAASATIRICMEYAGNSTNDTINQCFGTIQPNFFTPYIQTYSWSPTTGVSDPTIPNPLISPFPATTYTLTRTDSCGIQRFDTLTINAFNGVDPLPPATIICEGDTFFADLGVYPNYTWPDGATANPRPLTQPGTYSVTITDQGSGCSVIDSIQLFVADLNLQATNVNVCYGDTTEISARPPFAAFWSDFDNGLSAGWLPADTMSYLYEQTAGPFGNDTAQWTLLNLPEHDQVTVSFTLYIFDSWDGNNLPDGPDLWGFRADGSSIINTAFSNVSSNQQSYPDDYQIDYPAFTGSAMQDLPPRCTPTSRTTVYNIQKTFSHSDCDLVLEWFGNLTNAGSAPWCDESWAIDNVVATTNTAPPTSGCPPGFSWSNGAVTTTFIDTITDTTTYVYTADFGSIICSDTLVVNKLGNPFDPFQDSLFICWDQQVTLNAGSGYVSFLWSTGATTQTILLSAGGQYWVEAYDDAFSCLGRDSVWIERTAEPLLTSDTTLCEGSLLQLSLDTLYGPDYQVLWSTGVAVNSISLNVSASDTVWVAVSNSQITCYDSLYVNGANYHLLLDDTTVWCPNEPLLYSAVQGADRYDWSTGDSTANTYFLDQGWYYLTVTSGSCIQRDSLWHQWFNDYSDIVPDSTAECSPYALDLSNLPWTTMNVEPVGYSGNYIVLDQSDTYYLSGTDFNGCAVADTMILWIGVYPDVELYYQEDCPTTSLWYTSNDTATFQGWSIDGNEIPAPQLDTVIQGYENLELTAWLHNYCGVDSAFVTYEPGCFPRGVIYIPNAFTPNGDNVNDYFRPQGDEFEKFEYQIFNRWGELVFNGDDKDSGWDGSVNGEPVSTITVFVVRVRVWYSDGTIEEERTTLRLIR